MFAAANAQQGSQTGNPVASFLRSPEFTICLSIYDTRRGQREGEEYDRVLGFFPTHAPLATRMSIVGLAQAITSFTSSFSQDDQEVKVMEADHNRWVMVQCEPSIWIMMVMSKSWLGGSCCNAAAAAFLRMVHAIHTLMHGPIDRELQQDPTAHMLRRCLQPFLDEVGSRLLRPETHEASNLSNPLGQHAGMPLLATHRAPFLAVQSLVQQLLTSSVSGWQPVQGVMVTWQGHPVWSSLASRDSVALHHLAQRALLPVAGIARRKGSKLRAAGASAGQGEPVLETLLSPQQWAVSGLYQQPQQQGHAAWGGGAASTASTPRSAAGSGNPAAGAAAPVAAPAAAGRSGLAAAAVSYASYASSSISSAGSMLGAATVGMGAAVGSALTMPLHALGLAPQAAAPPGAGAAPSGQHQHHRHAQFSTLPQSYSAAEAEADTPRSSAAAAASAASASAASASAASASAGGPQGAAPQAAGPHRPTSPTPSTSSAPATTGFLIPKIRPPARAASQDGLMHSHLSHPHQAQPPVIATPRVWLQGCQEPALLLPFFHGPLMVLLLLHEGLMGLSQDVLATLTQVLANLAPPAAAQLAASVPNHNLWHEPGYRYCSVDDTCMATRATPAKKVTTLSQGSLRLMSHVRNKLDYWRDAEELQAQQAEAAVAAAAAAVGSSGTAVAGPAGSCLQQGADDTAGAQEGAQAAADGAGKACGLLESGGNGSRVSLDSELVCRSGADTWIVARRSGNRALYVALDQAPVAPALPAIGGHVQRLCDVVFPGMFL